MDTLIRGGTVVTCDDGDRVVEGDVVVRGGAIVRVGAGAVTRTEPGPLRVVDAAGCAVIPGFVQAHVHLCQALMRGMADDMALLTWLRERIWPLEAAHDEDTLTASAELGLAEMVRAGTTTILDMGTVHGHDAIFAACERSGIRAFSGKAMMDLGDGVPRRLRESTRGSLRESERLCRAWAGRAGGKIGYAFAPRFILSCSEGLIRGAAERAADTGALLHTHAAEHPAERQAVREAMGDEDIAILRRWGVHGPRAVLAHGVQVTDAEARSIARDGTNVVHCPSANLKLGSGIAKVARLAQLGVSLALGADGAPCNNNMDPWTELRHAALLANVRTGVATLPARRALRLATIDGARALGLGALTGSIEVGKRGDLLVVRLDGLHAEPGRDVFAKLVYACKSSDVAHVFVDGEALVRDGQLVRVDADDVAARARSMATRLVARAGL